MVKIASMLKATVNSNSGNSAVICWSLYMDNKDGRRSIPKCGCRGCLNSRLNRSGKNFCLESDEATDAKNPPPIKQYSDTIVECSCGFIENDVSKLRSNHGVFVKFIGPTNAASLSPAVSVTNTSNSRTSGCGFSEKNTTDGTSFVCDVESSNYNINCCSINAPEEYVRSITIWQGFLIKPLNVRTRRSPSPVLQKADPSNNGLLLSGYTFSSGKSQLENTGLYKNKGEIFYPSSKV